jgi:hypothetical protein
VRSAVCLDLRPRMFIGCDEVRGVDHAQMRRGVDVSDESCEVGTLHWMATAAMAAMSMGITRCGEILWLLPAGFL